MSKRVSHLYAAGNKRPIPIVGFIWQEMKDVLHQAGIRNYTIWNVGNELFGYYECDSVAEAARVQAQSEVVDRWNEYMADILELEMDPVTGAQPKLEPVFRLD